MNDPLIRALRIADEALERPPGEREAFVAEACGGDANLLREVLSLVAADEAAGDFLDRLPDLDVHAVSGTAWLDVHETPRPEPSPTALLPGTVLDDRYRIEALIGRGGMGEVYRATQLQLERPVAVKVLRGERPGETALKRFRREALAVARLKHPNIVAVYDLGSTPGGGAYIVMELVEGRTLRSELRERGRFPAEMAVTLLRQVCSAVHAAHAAGIVHRDLKPDNILLEAGDPVNDGFVAKVLDFGIARLLGDPDAEAELLTVPGVLVGTPVYMSPEQCKGFPADARSDVYALGCMLYQMLTGRPPFLADDLQELLRLHTETPPKPPSLVAPDIGPTLEAAALRALAKRPEDRFQTVADFAAALAPSGGHTQITPASASTMPGVATTILDAPSPLRVEPRPASGNLSQPLTSFVGREREIAEVRERLASTRLLTLVGPGGIGKTRLAIETASLAGAEYRDGAWGVDLAPLNDPTLVPQAVSRALGVHEEAGQSLEATLARWLLPRQMLLVLDNCEHVVDACAHLAEDLLRACPDLRVLATSREPLGAQGEAIWPVPSLEAPEPAAAERLNDFGATRLFLERARLCRPDYSATGSTAVAVAELCRRLDGIPLAIELAAARLRALSVEQILARVDDRFRLLTGARGRLGRHQTLRAAVDWSHGLLDEAEKVLFRRLAVFAGGWTLSAAEEVAGCWLLVAGSVPTAHVSDATVNPETARATSNQQPATAEVLQHLERLVDKSLVVADEWMGETRYRMLETIREYARERLAESGEEAALVERHRDWVVAWAERARAGLDGDEAAVWLDRFEAEIDNFRAALRRGLRDPGATPACLRLCCALNRFWAWRGHVGEGRRWFAAALAAPGASQDADRAKALQLAGGLASFVGDFAEALRLLDEALAIQRALDDKRGLVRSVYTLSRILATLGDYERAASAAEESLALAREVGDWNKVAWAGATLGELAAEREDFEEAKRRLGDAIAVMREHGSLMDVGMLARAMSEIEIARGNLDQAEALVEESARIGRELGDALSLAKSRRILGTIAIERGQHERAEAMQGQALRVFGELGNRNEAILAFEGLARTAAERGDARRALRLSGVASGLRDAMHVKGTLAARQAEERYLEPARRALGADAEPQFAEGRRLAFEDAVAEALGTSAES